MAEQKVLFISPCFGAKGSTPNSKGDTIWHRKGDIITLDDEDKVDSKTLLDLFAAGRIVPAEKVNIERCLAELKKKEPKSDNIAKLEAILNPPKTSDDEGEDGKKKRKD